MTETTTDLARGVAEAQLILVCSPVETIAEQVIQVADSCSPTAIITDAGSTKLGIVERVAAGLPGGKATFVGSHPLAGSEKTGVAHAQPHLFRGRTVVVTPTAETPASARDRLCAFWTGLDASVITMSPAEHDAAVASTSHLPHVVASVLAAVTPEVYLPLVATGWLDTTRIATGDVELWRQILSENRTSVLRCLEQFAKVLDSLTVALRQRDDLAVTELLATGKQRRDALAD